MPPPRRGEDFGDSEDVEGRVIRLKPYVYVHIEDTTKGVTRPEAGPQTITLEDNEELVLGPAQMIVIPPRHWCLIKNPIRRSADGKPEQDEHGQYRLHHGDEEIRFEQEPFLLYPGEQQVGEVQALQVVEDDQALHLRAVRNFTEDDEPKTERKAGDEWLFRGPATYTPRVEVKVVGVVEAQIIGPNQALRLRATEACEDSTGQARSAGEEWLISKVGAYIPEVTEGVVGVVDAVILTQEKALHLRALRTFTDVYDKERKAGDEWLVTIADTEAHIPDVYEQTVSEVKITTLNDRQWCVVVNPVGDDGKPQLGVRVRRQGRGSFFLHPGEMLEGEGVKNVYVLQREEALLIEALAAFEEQGDEGPVHHKPGDRWLVKGPSDYIPPVEAKVVEKRTAMPLDKNEGIYVRDITTGNIRLVRGDSYMLAATEELWNKDLPAVVEGLLYRDPIFSRNVRGGPASGTRGYREPAAFPSDREEDSRRERRSRDDFEEDRALTEAGALGVRKKHMAVVYHVPQNTAVQVHDYRANKARVVFGPDVVMLEPEEEFTVLNLSGDTPKTPNKIQAIALMLGPDFMTDEFDVETADHAQLRIRAAYNWRFAVDREDLEAATRIFSVPDFVGDACKSVASRVRAAVAAVTFDEFHRNSARIIRGAVFGTDADGHIKDSEPFSFPANGLQITNVDIQSADPKDEETRDKLRQSVALAIKITTDASEAAARQEAARLETKANAALETQKIEGQRDAAKARQELLTQEAENEAISKTGAATAVAEAQAKADQLVARSKAELAAEEVRGQRTRAEADLEIRTQANEAELAHLEKRNALEEAHAARMADIQADAFKKQVEALGQDTIAKIAAAGPAAQAELLKALGLNSTIFVDPNNPINLMLLAQGMVPMVPTALPSPGAATTQAPPAA